MVFKGTTRAYKRMKNDMFWSEIASQFKEPNVTPPLTVARTTAPNPPPPPPTRTELPLSNSSFATHARINNKKVTGSYVTAKL